MESYAVLPRPTRDQLGEGPHWVARTGMVFWVDIVGRTLWRHHLANGAIDSWAMPEPIGWAVAREGRDDLLIGLKSGVAALSLDPFAITPIVAPEPDRPYNRLNDAKVDAAGRLWFGSKDDRDQEASGALYRMGADLAPVRIDDGYKVTNGPTFSPDGRWLYHNDSGRGRVYRFALQDDGSLGPREDFIRFEDAWGAPDGMTTDADGCLWIAQWGGGRVSRFDPQGRVMRAIALPARNITSCAFAGAALDRMFVTSAAVDDGESELAGAVFEVEPGVKGLTLPAFRG